MKRSIHADQRCEIATLHDQGAALTTFAGADLRQDLAVARSADEAEGLQETAVTAQKRSESTNHVGISFTAASGAEMLARGVNMNADLTKLVPGFAYSETPSGRAGVRPTRRRLPQTGARRQPGRYGLYRRGLASLFGDDLRNQFRHGAGRGSERAAGNALRSELGRWRHQRSQLLAPLPSRAQHIAAIRQNVHKCSGEVK